MSENDDLISDFVLETNDNVRELEVCLDTLEKSPGERELVHEAFRRMHTIKGTCGFLDLHKLEGVSHEAENLLSHIRDEKLEASADHIELLRRSVKQIKYILHEIEKTGGEPESLLDLPADIDISPALHDKISDQHTPTVGDAWRKVPLLVKDLCEKLGKKAGITMLGEDIPLPFEVSKAIENCTIQLVRNAVDHGIETPEKRRTLGKDEMGSLKLEAFCEDGDIVINIADDGKGLNGEAIRERSVDLELVTEDQVSSMTQEQVWMLIFEPGFSTADNITTVSGRGVGMDVVESAVASLSGSIDIQSKNFQGTTFTIRIPMNNHLENIGE